MLAASAADGCFVGHGIGARGDVSAYVVIADGRIESVVPGESLESEGPGTSALKAISQKVVEAQSINVDGVSGATLTSTGYLSAIRDAVDANRDVCLCALRSSGRDYLKRFFEHQVDFLIRSTIEQIGSSTGALNLIATEKDIQFMTQFFKVSLAAILESWLLGELDYTPEELIQFTDRMLQDHIRGASIRAQETLQALQ